MAKNGAKSKNKQKGTILDDVVALLHDDPNVIVRKRQHLPTLTHPERTREIDVLVIGEVIGRPMRLAFECKNYGKSIGVGKVDEFKGRLEEVGIPPQYGIFVTAGGFTTDARQRAKSIGMRLLHLEGLTKERMSAEVHEAFQSVVYLLAVVSSVTITSGVDSATPMELMFLGDQNGAFVGGIPDLIWARWRDGKIPLGLGEHHLAIRIPSDWQWTVGGIPTEAHAEATVIVEAVVVTQSGEANRFILKDADTGEVNRAHIGVRFHTEPNAEGNIVLPVQIARSEGELQDLLGKPGLARAHIGRIPLPRIIYNGNIFWPPSLRVMLELRERARALEQAGKWEPGVLANLSLSEVEGTDLSAMWDEVIPGHPALYDSTWPWPQRKPRGRTDRPNMRSKVRSRTR